MFDPRSLDNESSIRSAFLSRAALAPDSVVYREATRDPGEGLSWVEYTYKALQDRVEAVARHLFSVGVCAGTPVGIVANTRIEWSEIDLAIQLLGGITVSLYPSLTAGEIAFILADSGSEVLILENKEQHEKIEKIRRGGISPHVTLRHIVSIESEGIPAEVTTYQSILASPDQTTPLPEPDLNRASIASFVYTSGTTGVPKGVKQTHGNHLSNVRQVMESGVCAAEGEIFLFLPLAHAFARLMHYIGALTAARCSFPAVVDRTTSKLQLSTIAADLSSANATNIPAVPRLFEKMKETLLGRASKRSLSAFILRKCLESSQKMLEAKERGSAPPISTALWYSGTAPIRIKVKRALFGSNFDHAISGGAKLPVEVNKFFEALSILILEGYGLTETCVATHVNLPNKRKIGSVGAALPDVETKILEDGEVAIRGPNITPGYYNRDEATRAAWDDQGWFHTGDIGSLDEEGFLTITGRKKELIVTAGGKKVAPTLIESHFKKSAFFSQFVPFGEGKKYLVALATLNLEYLEQKHPDLLKDLKEPLTSGPLFDAVLREVTQLNEELATFEQIKNFAILHEDFSVENGLLTPTQKPRRELIFEEYQGLVESLYR